MQKRVHKAAIGALLIIMFFLAGGAALHESATVDEVAHVGAGLSYLQRLDLRLNPEHPPLGKALAAFPLAIRGAHADYSGGSWKVAADFFPAYGAQWIEKVEVIHVAARGQECLEDALHRDRSIGLCRKLA